ncbi:MAG: site-2 protease family protein [Methanobacterium sp.]|jgi:membrane-associated protease RseP (regulator of RpoE activity)
MDALWFYAIAFIVIWVLATLFKDELKIEINGPLLMRKTQRLRGFINSIAQISPRFWKYAMNMGIPIAVFFMAYTLYAIIMASTMIFQSPHVVPILPGVDYPGNPLFLPLSYGLIGLVTVIVVHEFAHGILARAEGISIKSIGLLLLAVLPGAFVEPDEEEIKKAKRLSKLRIYAAGSVFNITFAGICIVIVYALSSFFIPTAFHSDGIIVSSVVPTGPSDGVLKEGMVIYSINGQEIKNLTDYTAFRNKIKINDILTFKTNQGTFTVKTEANPNNPTLAYAGFRPADHLVVNKNISDIYGDVIPWTLFFFNTLLSWVGLLNLAIGTINLLPMKPLDGGLIFEELLSARMSENRVNSITTRFKLFLHHKLRLKDEKAREIASGIRKILSLKISEKNVNIIVSSVSWVLLAILVVNIVYGVGRGILLSL